MSDCKGIYQKVGGNQQCYSSEKSASEQGKTFVINSKKHPRVCRIKLDKCLIPEVPHQKQCDYLFVKLRDNDEFEYLFVELKGNAKEASYAFEQICQAIEFIKKKVGQIPQKHIRGFIVGGKDTQEMNRLKEKFKRSIGLELKHSTGSRYEF